ncbi:MAG TPA: 1-acyl-sn-glycerol-3-phosphate acyltransferase [Polyangiaceae bacterium]
MTRRVVERVLRRSETALGPTLDDVAYETIYAEQVRLSHAEPDLRTESDRAFVGRFRHELAHASEERRRVLIHAAVERYAQEIAGHFKLPAYRVATRVVPPALSILLNGFAVTRPHAFDIDDRVLVQGEVRTLLALCRIGTVILVPTHVSNLDSLVLGSVIYRLGLPPFAFAAGLNLFSNELIGFFMRHLGAYTVDRKKTDPLYRETLKEYATLLVERGQHSLVFPGGTRSRSGAIEGKLKLGLLGIGPLAYRNAVQTGREHPNVFVVPCTLNYPLVLEAATLIDEYLKTDSGAHYVDARDEFDKPRRWLDFLRGLRKLDERVHLRFSRPLDWLGNEVDEHGVSHDARGRRLDLTRYLHVNGRLTADEARDSEYTRLLAARIVAAFRRDNAALPTHIAAFVLLECVRRRRGRLDSFRLLRSLGPELGIPVSEVTHQLAAALLELGRLADRGAISFASDVSKRDAQSVLRQALATFATYHRVPIVEQRGDTIHVLDPGLLFYYRNRLEGYGLLGAPDMLGSGAARARHT